jgi:hypothetical protein
MKKIVITLVLFAVFAPVSLRAQTTNCDYPLFGTTNPLDINGQTCYLIKDYYGGAEYLTGTNGCDGWAFGMATGGGYMTFGPTTTAIYVGFSYYVKNNGHIRIEYAPDWTLPYGPPANNWTYVDDFQPTHQTCTYYVTPTVIPAGVYVRLSQPPGTANGSGPYKLYLTTIEPINPQPVELTTFSAGRIGTDVKLTWKTKTEKNNFGFEIERSTSSATWEKIGFVPGSGTSNTPLQYSYTDKTVAPTGNVQYRLRQIDRDGSDHFSATVNVSFGAIKGFGLQNAYPNPFNPTTTLSFSLPQDARVTMKIYNESGQEVALVMENETMAAGSYSRTFDARSLPSGKYFAWMFTDANSSILPLYLVK